MNYNSSYVIRKFYLRNRMSAFTASVLVLHTWSSVLLMLTRMTTASCTQGKPRLAGFTLSGLSWGFIVGLITTSIVPLFAGTGGEHSYLVALYTILPTWNCSPCFRSLCRSDWIREPLTAKATAGPSGSSVIVKFSSDSAFFSLSMNWSLINVTCGGAGQIVQASLRPGWQLHLKTQTKNTYQQNCWHGLVLVAKAWCMVLRAS